VPGIGWFREAFGGAVVRRHAEVPGDRLERTARDRVETCSGLFGADLDEAFSLPEAAGDMMVPPWQWGALQNLRRPGTARYCP
jgi:hypothetical protein